MSGRITHIGRTLPRLSGDDSLFRELAEQSGDVLSVGEADGLIRYVSPAVQRVLGHDVAGLAGRSVFRLLHPADVPRLRATYERARSGGVREATIELRARHRSGHWLWLESRLRWIPGGGEEGWRWVASLRDITERRRFEQRLAAEKERAQATLRAIADGVISVAPDGRIDYLNPAAERITGWSAGSAVGRPVTSVFMPSGHRAPPPENEGLAGLSAWFHAVADAPAALRRRDGSECVVQVAVAAVADSEGRPQGLVLTFRDTSQTAALLRELAYRSSHDSLTGLYNREEFERQLKRLVLEANAGSGPHALCYLDLDQFKLVNDTCGHAAGDALLKDVAQTLRSALGEGDVLARLGGDEFGVLMPQRGTAEAARRAQALVDALSRMRFEWSERQFVITGSVGVAPVSRQSGTYESVLMAADAACYIAKERGRNRVHVSEPADVDLVRRQGEMRWIPRLQTALEVGDFHLLAHDIVPVQSGIPTGRHIEVLISLPDASGRLVPPGEFLPAALHYGLMGRIDRWVIGQVCEWLQWRSHTGRALPELVAINLSGSSMSDAEFRDYLEEQVRALPTGGALCFEITESEAIANLAEVGDFMRRMKDYGCRFALDDFGSGLNSFAYLKRLPVDYIKIDGQFVRDAAQDGINLAMVESIHRIGKVMGVRTIAEFVENEAIFRRIREIGVDYCQGFLFGMPRPLLNLD
ncbi:MAG: EAL domain-containing protein [Rehaibacterium terrae]|uniref:EAL domain-containing protein n=1 Tax=Rehaibacterium terrae TaxID=1341696 RepID=UPI00391C071C